MAKNMPENQNGEEEVKEVRISREELKQARREAKAAKKAASEKEKLQKTDSDNKNQKVKAKTDANAKPKLGKRISKAFKEMISELKKVTWLKGKAVLQSTLIVCVVVLVFLVILTAMDFGLGKLLELLVEKAGAYSYYRSFQWKITAKPNGTLCIRIPAMKKWLRTTLKR